MIIDFHTHTFPDKIARAAVEKLQAASHTAAFSDGTVSGLNRSMARAGVDLSVVLPVATNPLKVSSVNDSSIRLNGQDGMIHFGCMHPECEIWHEELGRIARSGLKGIKLHPVYQGVDIDDPRFVRILARAGELGLTVVMHAGDDIGFPGVVRCSPAMTLRAIRQAEPVRLVLAHMGGWRNWNEVCELLSGTSVYLDTAFSLGRITPIDNTYTEKEQQLLSDEAFCRMVRLFGSHRILFGTDSPWTDQQDSVQAIRALPLSDEEKQNILGENARKLMYT